LKGLGSAWLGAQLRPNAYHEQSRKHRFFDATSLNNSAIEWEKRGAFNEALAMYDKAATTDSNNLTYSRNEALLLCRMGHTEEAIARLRNIGSGT